MKTTLDAADMLCKKGIQARVVNLFTWKPIDMELIIDSAKKTKAVVTVENHNVINGLGSAVAEVLSENRPTIMERIGCQDHFGEVGSVDYLQGLFHMTAEDIVEKASKVLKMARSLQEA